MFLFDVRRADVTTLPEKLYRVDEVMELFECSRSSVYLWVQHKHLEARPMRGSVMGITRESIVTWAAHIKKTITLD